MFYSSRYHEFDLRARQMRDREIRRIVHALTSALAKSVRRMGRASAAAAGVRTECARTGC